MFQKNISSKQKTIKQKENVMKITLIALILCISNAMAVVMFNDGFSHNVNSQINDDVWVDFSKPTTSTEVNFNSGSTLSSPYRLRSFNNGRINISGGSVGSSVTLSETSKLNVFSGSMGDVAAYNYSSINLTGGTAGGIALYDKSKVSMSNAYSKEILTYGDNLVSISNSELAESLHLFGGGTGTVSNSLISFASVHEYGTLTMSDSTVGYIGSYGFSHLTLSDVTVVNDLSASDGSFLEIYSGTILCPIVSINDATLVLYGYDFAIDGIPVGYGEITSLLSGSWEDEPYRRLTGTFAGGDKIDNLFKVGDSASINLVYIPEPSILSLIGLSCLFWYRRNRVQFSVIEVGT